MPTTKVLKLILNNSIYIGTTGVVLITGIVVVFCLRRKPKMKLYRKLKQWVANRVATTELIGYVEGKVVQGELKRIEAKLAARIDALELYVEDVTDKYMKKGLLRARDAERKEAELTVEPLNGFETIRQKYGGKE